MHYKQSHTATSWCYYFIYFNIVNTDASINHSIFLDLRTGDFIENTYFWRVYFGQHPPLHLPLHVCMSRIMVFCRVIDTIHILNQILVLYDTAGKSKYI